MRQITSFMIDVSYMKYSALLDTGVIAFDAYVIILYAYMYAKRY